MLRPFQIGRRRERGQGMTEYALILALVVLGTIAVVTIFGNQLRSLWSSSSKRLSGQQNVEYQDKSGNVDQEVDKDLKNAFK
ncbi:MAG: Flp family type IVb pilin [Planctomycetota bacterium]